MKELTLKVSHKALLYHKVTAYDHVIAYDRFAFFVVDMEAVFNNLAAREIQHGKGTLTSCIVHYNPAAVLYSTLLGHILRS